MPFPPPDTTHPMLSPNGEGYAGVVFLNAVLEQNASLQIGDYSYYSDDDLPSPEQIRRRLFPYLYGEQRIEIGKFCSLAMGVSFVTDSANHRYDGFSAYPFAVFDGMDPSRPSLPGRAPRPTIVGHDCWFGRGAMILPGARIGNGVIAGAGAVVGGHVPDYTLVAGNPARIIRHRFDPDTVAALNEIAWWDWPIDRILAAEAAICGADLDALRRS